MVDSGASPALESAGAAGSNAARTPSQSTETERRSGSCTASAGAEGKRDCRCGFVGGRFRKSSEVSDPLAPRRATQLGIPRGRPRPSAGPGAEGKRGRRCGLAGGRFRRKPRACPRAPNKRAARAAIHELSGECQRTPLARDLAAAAGERDRSRIGALPPRDRVPSGRGPAGCFRAGVPCPGSRCGIAVSQPVDIEESSPVFHQLY